MFLGIEKPRWKEKKKEGLAALLVNIYRTHMAAAAAVARKASVIKKKIN